MPDTKFQQCNFDVYLDVKYTPESSGARHTDTHLPVTGAFPSRNTSYEESGSMSWRHHEPANGSPYETDSKFHISNVSNQMPLHWKW